MSAHPKLMPTVSDPASRETADRTIDWLRTYAATRINSRTIDERRAIAPHVVLDFGNRGLFGLQAPTALGGLNLSHVDTVRVYQQLGAIDLTVATLVSSHANGLHTIQTYGSHALRARVHQDLASGRAICSFALTEAAAGSNPRAIRTRAEPHARGGWKLNGDKYLVDSGSWASMLTVFAQTFDAHGVAQGISAFAIAHDAAGLTVGHESPTFGLRGMVQTSLGLRDVTVGPEALVGSVGAGMAISQHTLLIARLNLAAKCLGAMKCCLRTLYRFALRRTIATGLLWENPVTLVRTARLVGALGAIETLCDVLARSLDAGRPMPAEAFFACKVAASEFLWETIQITTRVLGGRGYEEPNGLAQMLRDAQSFLFSEGPSEALTMQLGSRLVHAGHELDRFVATELEAPDVAKQLRAFAQQWQTERAAEDWRGDDIGRDDESWHCYLVGQLAIRGLLFAAASHRKSAAGTLDCQWAQAQFAQGVEPTSSPSDYLWALGVRSEIEARISSFDLAIGDVEQRLLGLQTAPDPLLRSDAQELSPSNRAENTLNLRAPAAAAPAAAAAIGIVSLADRQQEIFGWNETDSQYRTTFVFNT